MTVSTEVAVRAQSLPDKIEYAKYLAASGLLPAQYRDKPANVLYATEFGDMIGIPPMASILGVHVIEGRPSASAALISALVRRAGHRIRTWGDDEKAVTEIIRADDPSFTYRVEWTIARAQRAGLTGKGVWKNYPAAMLKARTVTEAARDACQEVLFGLQYTPEELGAEVGQDGEPIQATAVRTDRPADPDWASKPATTHERTTGQPEAPAAAPERDWDAEIRLAIEIADADALRALWRAARAARPADVQLRERIAAASKQLVAAEDDPAPAADDGVVDAEVVDEPPADDEPVDEQKQHRHMHALWNKAELSRDERLAVTSHLVGRDITTSKDLTPAEVDTVLSRLRAFESVGKSAMQDQIDRWLEAYATKAAAATT